MILNGKDYDLSTLVKNLDKTANSYIKVGNLMLNKREIDILNRNFISYKNAKNLHDLRIRIEEAMKDETMDEDDAYELEFVLESIMERDYYDYKSHRN